MTNNDTVLKRYKKPKKNPIYNHIDFVILTPNWVVQEQKFNFLFRIILDRDHFDLSSTPPSLFSPVLTGSHQSVSGLRALNTTPLLNFYVLLLSSNVNILRGVSKDSYVSVSSFRPACGVGLAQTGRIITCCYHTHSR